MTRPRTLRRKLALLIAGTSLVSLVVFAAVAYLAVYLEDAMKLKVLPEADDDTAQFLLLVFAVAAPLGVGVVLSGVLPLARRGLRPIEDVIRAGGEMSLEHLGMRLEVPAGDDELRLMVHTLNDLFARLESGFQGLHSFSADVAHELRTPLAVAISELEVALRRPRSPAEWSETAGQVLRSLRRMVQLVEAMLELARGGIAAPREPVDLVDLAEEVVSGHAARAHEAGVTLAHLSSDAVTTEANRAALATALGALLGNALRYTPAGGSVHVTVEPGARGGMIHVDDSGPGVPPDERDVIFAPLRRGSAGSEAPGEEAGLGLGLAIVRRVVEQHGGAVAVTDSALGGARFTIFMKS